jgi:transcriptional regulator with XRE-family HTH domain
MKADQLPVLLRKKRIASGHTQNQVAVKLGYSSPQFISNWERGLSCPPVNVIGKISSLYKVSENELFELIVSATIVRVESNLRREFKSRRKGR